MDNAGELALKLKEAKETKRKLYIALEAVLLGSPVM